MNCQERIHCRNDILCRELDDKEEPSVQNLQEDPLERRKIKFPGRGDDHLVGEIPGC